MSHSHDLTLERHQGGERVVLVHIDFHPTPTVDAFEEFKELVKGTGADVLHVITGKRHKPAVKYFVGVGKAEDIRDTVSAHRAELVIFNHTLTPSQERNLERLCQCRVLDRTGLILDIFSRRARTFEGKLQVELAQLRHLSTRLVRGWTHLERQKGGIGLRGPGETQLETDRRLLGQRIKAIGKRLEKVRSQRALSRRARSRADRLTVALVGYTNAGKSTLFNQLVASDVYVADQLFATLDPTLRSQILPGLGHVVFADTVGFIQALPHDLVAAFHATLEETREAALLLHVIDASSSERKAQEDAVHAVLLEIGAEHVPVLQVYNKIDLIEQAKARVDLDLDDRPERVWCSALTGQGLPELKTAITRCLNDTVRVFEVVLLELSGELRARLYGEGAVLKEAMTEAGETLLTLQLPAGRLQALVDAKQVRKKAFPPAKTG